MNDEGATSGNQEIDQPIESTATGEITMVDEVEFVSTEPPAAPTPPGPGLPEALGWTFGLFTVMLVASVVWGVLFAVFLASQGHSFTPGTSMSALLDDLSVNTRIMFLLPPSLLAFVVVIPLGLIRLGRRRLGKLNISPPSLTQLLIVLAAVYPTTIISTPMFGLADQLWMSLSEGNPALEEFNEQTSVMLMVEQYFQNGSLALLLFFLAVVPAVGEEFVFRGVIGRGLMARWGLWWGVAITSCLFALVHLYPPHIVAVLPIGIMMHVVYLSTRSFWAPVLFHFANNGMAATFVALGVVTDDELAWWMPVAAAAYLGLSIMLLYHYRTRYVDDGGKEVGPGYLTVEEPPPEVNARRYAPNGRVVAPLIVLVLAGTVLYIGNDLAQTLDAQPIDGEADAAVLDTEAPGIRSQVAASVRDPASSPCLSSNRRMNA